MIDVHHHMFPPSLVASMSSAGVDRVGGEPVPVAWTPDASLRVMDRYGIQAAILSSPVPLSFAEGEALRRVAREINEYGHRVASRWRGCFGFFASLPLPDVDAAIDELRHALDDLGAEGVALLTNHAGLYQGDDRLEPVYAELDARGAVCFVHPTVSAADCSPDGNGSPPLAAIQPSVLEYPFDTTRAIANVLVGGTLRKFPRIKFIFTHSGGCVTSVANRLIDRRPLVSAYKHLTANSASSPMEQLEQLLADAQRAAIHQLAELHYDVALSSDAQALSALTELVSSDRLLLGTDFPMAREIGLHATLIGIDRFAGFTEEDRRALSVGNATTLFPRLAKQAARAVVAHTYDLHGRHNDALIREAAQHLANTLAPYRVLTRERLADLSGKAYWHSVSFDAALRWAIRHGLVRDLGSGLYELGHSRSAA